MQGFKYKFWVNKLKELRKQLNQNQINLSQKW
jgi:hypothetical protein